MAAVPETLSWLGSLVSITGKFQFQLFVHNTAPLMTGVTTTTMRVYHSATV